MKKLIKKYNQKDTVLVISTYPKKGQVYTAGMGGVASFTKNTLSPLSGRGQRIVVLANKLNGKNEVYNSIQENPMREHGDELNADISSSRTKGNPGREAVGGCHQEGNILVIRCWQRGTFSLFVSLWKWLKKFDQSRNVLVHFEFALYDGLWKTLFFSWFLLGLRLLGKKTALILHQVIFDLSELSGHLGWKKKGFNSWLFSKGISAFYILMAFVSNKIVVLEEGFAKRLISLNIPKEKIEIIPHGVDFSLKAVPKKEAKRILGFKREEKIILVFGFLSWYKGSDLILRKFKNFADKNPDTCFRLVLAGGKSPTQSGKLHYERYLKSLYKIARRCPNAKITGFVEEKDVPLYFSASDVVALPYRTFMSSSGPLSLAISFEKPFVLSKKYQGILETEDFKSSMTALDIKAQDLVFNGFDYLLEEGEMKKVEKLSKLLKKKRCFENLSQRYMDLLMRLEFLAPARGLSPAFRG